MVSANKILTVSYGTFSCTLEGFDDPFSTMRSIAEYFRDLAADDRYFGAEPPQPDAEMLHRIAERELRRPVEARIEESGLILRQADDLPADEADEDVQDREDAAEAVQAAPELTEEAQETAAETAQPERTEEEAPLTKAERKARRRARQARKDRRQNRAEAALPAENPEAGTSTDAPQTRKRPSAPEQPAATEADLSDASIAAKLMRIRAVVESGGDDAEDIAGENDAIDPARSADFYADIRRKPPAEAGMVDEELHEELRADPGMAMPGTASSGEDAEEDLLEQIAEAARQPEEPEEPEEPTAPLAEKALTEDGDGEVEDGDFLGRNAFADDTEDENDTAQEPPRPVAIARVIKVRKARQAPAEEAGDAAGQDKTPPESPAPAASADPDEPARPAPQVESSLSPEDEAALMAELAEVEREAARMRAQDAAGEDAAGEKAGEADEIKQGEEEETAPRRPQPRTAFDDGDIAGADAIDRILAETDAKLMSDEASRRRASIAHLRAAVQAKRAERRGGTKAEEAGPEAADPYREDLGRAVQPRRPAATGQRTARRMAPLVLVSEQRIDTDKPEEARPTPVSRGEPVRPRRVQPQVKADAPQAGEAGKRGPVQEFSAFLEKQGASSPEEMLEAAAAFRIFVIGQETFSRPQIMGLVLKCDQGAALTREEGLRAFGKLIREGVIRKIQRGRYTVSESTRFRPGQARASA